MTMTTPIFFFQVACALGLMTLVTRWYVMPKLRTLSTSRALELVLYTGAIRFLGTTLLIEQVTGGAAKSWESAIGDLLCAGIATSGIVANHADSKAGRPLAWLYVVVGTLDLLWTVVRGTQNGLWENLGGVWTLAVAVFPAVVVAIGVMAVLLVKPNEATSRASSLAGIGGARAQAAG